MSFREPQGSVYLTDMMQKKKITDVTMRRNQGAQEIVYRGFRSQDSDVLYWSLPKKFLGNKVTAYGGKLRFTLKFRAGPDDSPVNMNNPVVEIGVSSIYNFEINDDRDNLFLISIFYLFILFFCSS